MAQIENDGAADEDAVADTLDADAPESETGHESSAESEALPQEDRPVENNGPQNEEIKTSEQARDGGQLNAPKTDISQITNTNQEKAKSEPAESEDKESKAEQPISVPAGKSAERANNDAAKDTLDISGDIDDILQEITSGDDTPLIAEPATDETAIDVGSDSDGHDGDIVARVKEDQFARSTDKIEISPPIENAPTPLPSEATASANQPSTRQSAENRPTSDRSRTPRKPSPMSEVRKSDRKKKIKPFLASAVAILCLGTAGIFYGTFKSGIVSNASAPTTSNHHPEEMVQRAPAAQPQQPAAVDHQPSGQSRLQTTAEALNRLRNQIIAKQAEIEELRAYYQAGIDAEVKGIIDTVRQVGKGKIALDAALANPRINLGLSAIQRRHAYIQKLKAPTNTLLWNSEELFYLSRKAKLLILMAGKTSDIDIDGFIAQATDISNALTEAMTALNIDVVPASPLTLKSIWQDIEKRLPATRLESVNREKTSRTDNAVIWKKICEGDFSEKHKLTALSAEAARCLAAWKGKDLFLNGLSELSPEAARHLAMWEGDWLGLNGLTEISPEAAAHLSRWKGTGLSLNGLSRLSPRVVAILSEWQGGQIELINVKHMAHWENPNTRLFLSKDLSRQFNAARK